MKALFYMPQIIVLSLFEEKISISGFAHRIPAQLLEYKIKPKTPRHVVSSNRVNYFIEFTDVSFCDDIQQNDPVKPY